MSKEIAVKDVSEFAVLQSDAPNIKELMQENFENEEFKPNDLDRINVPSGGGTTFEIPTVEGVEESKEINAVILMVKPLRMYWKQSFEESGGGTPPDCMSEDGVNGFGDPGVNCTDCPMNQFPADKPEDGKPCTEKRNVFIFPPNAFLPYVLSCPVKSIGNLKKYSARLLSAGKSINGVVTNISLEKNKNQKGITYSQLVFQMGQELTEQQKDMIKNYKEALSSVMDRTHRSTGSPSEEDAPAF